MNKQKPCDTCPYRETRTDSNCKRCSLWRMWFISWWDKMRKGWVKEDG